MKAPAVYRARTIQSWTTMERRTGPITGLPYFTPARPIHTANLRTRLKIAWGVFTGRYDALNWGD